VDPLAIYGTGPANNWLYPACNCTLGSDPTGNGGNCLPNQPGYVIDGGLNGPRAYSPAFQVAMATLKLPVPKADLCHSLGSALQPGPNPAAQQYLLLDVTNPSRGVGIKYTGGDPCQGGKRRSLTVWLQCDDDVNNKPDDEPVFENMNDLCSYEVYVKTAYGCPIECGGLTSNGKLCGGHGLCDFDTALRTSKCFCNDGFTGVDCTSPVAPPPTGLSAVASGLIVVCVFLVGTLAFLAFLWYRIRGLRLDPAAYSSLRAGPEEADKANLNAPSFMST
jgi:hypothetical protein